MNINTIDLKPFCSTDDTRPMLCEPSSQGQFTYATNARIIIEITRRDDVPEVYRYPKVDIVMSQFKPDGDWIDVPKDLPSAKQTECEKCEGTGGVVCNFGHDHECDYCEGLGNEVEVAKIKIGDRYFNADYLIKIKDLPNVKINQTGKGKEAMSYKFDGGRGIIMPIIIS